MQSKVFVSSINIAIERKYFILFFNKKKIICCIEMAGGGPVDNPNLKGLARYFNAETNFGRANVSHTNHHSNEKYYEFFFLFFFI